MTDALPILFREAWTEDIQVFDAEGDKLPFDANTQRLGPPARVTVNILNLHSVEVLAIEEHIASEPSTVGSPCASDGKRSPSHPA